MSDLNTFRDHARARANWPDGAAGHLRAACRDRTAFGTPKPADHANCGGDRCGCGCHEPTDRERAMWTALADEIDAYLAGPTAEQLAGRDLACWCPLLELANQATTPDAHPASRVSEQAAAGVRS